MNKPSNPAILWITAYTRPCKITSTTKRLAGRQAVAAVDDGAHSQCHLILRSRAHAETKSVAISRTCKFTYVCLITLAFLLIKPMERWKKYWCKQASKQAS